MLRMLEALLFAASEPLSEESLAAALPEGADVRALLDELSAALSARGVNLVQVAGKWCFRTAGDLSFLLRREASEQKRLSKAALETLGDRRLSPARHPRRDRGHPRRRHIQGHARHADGDRLGKDARPKAHARHGP